MSRWDAPLFTVVYDDASPPFEAIWDALIGSDGEKKTVAPNAATVLASRLASFYPLPF
jgi:protein KTI12